MKGIVFRELIDLIEEQFSVETADRIICSSGITSAGAYTSVGTYDHREIVTLVARSSDATGMATPDLLRMFGRHTFRRFSTLYPSHFDGHCSILRRRAAGKRSSRRLLDSSRLAFA